MYIYIVYIYIWDCMGVKRPTPWVLTFNKNTFCRAQNFGLSLCHDCAPGFVGSFPA